MDDLSGIRPTIYGGSSMAIGSAAPVPDFGAHGSDSQDAPPVRQVPDAAGVMAEDLQAVIQAGGDALAGYAWPYAQGVGHG